MQDIILVGSGGCMREIVWQIQERNKSAENWNILGYVDRMPPEEHSRVTVGNQIIKYIGNDDYLAIFLTLTTPSRFHKYSSMTNKLNPKFDKTLTINDAYKLLNSSFREIYKNFKIKSKTAQKTS